MIKQNDSDSQNRDLSEAMKIRFSADQKAAISVLAKRAGLNDSTFVRQLVHYHLLANHQIYAKLFPEESQKVAASQGRSNLRIKRNTRTNF